MPFTVSPIVPPMGIAATLAKLFSDDCLQKLRYTKSKSLDCVISTVPVGINPAPTVNGHPNMDAICGADDRSTDKTPGASRALKALGPDVAIGSINCGAKRVLISDSG